MNMFLLRKIFFSGIGSVLSKGCIYFVTIYCSHELSKLDFSLYSLILTTVTFIGGISTLGTSIIITDGVSKKKIKSGTLKKIKNKILPVSSLLFTSISLVIISDDIISESGYYIVFSLFILTYLISLENFFTAIFAGGNSFEYIAKVNLIKSLVLVSISIFLIKYLGVYGFIIAFSLSLFIVNVIYSRLNLDIKSEDKITMTAILNRSFPLFISDILVPGFIWGLSIYLARNFSMIEMAKFNLINQLGVLSIFIISSLMNPLLPYLNELKVNVDEKVYIYTPCYFFAIFALIVSKFNIYENLVGNDLLINMNSSINYVLGISLISIFKLSLVRKNIQKGNTYLSLISNLFWLLAVICGLYISEFNSVDGMFYILFCAHLSSLFFSVFIYFRAKILSINELLNFNSVLLFTFLYFIII